MKASKPKIRPSAEELALWRKVAETVKPLQDRPVPPPVKPPPDMAKPRVVAKVSQAGKPAPKPKISSKPKAKAPLETGRLADLDRRTGDRFRRGRMEIESTLDLHGMTQARAHGALRRFLLRAHGNGQRCLLVVTGKGRAGPGSGVLRQAVPHWLNDPDIRPIILAVTPAQQHHGGQGALYVLLRRHREGSFS
ncbi:MAG: Smr/MutS family protein [Kiloniellales bacterium]